MNKTKIGVFGVGHLGKHHARILNALPSTELVGVHDVDRQRGEEIAEREGVPYFQRWEDLLDRCEAVDVVTPTTYHHALAAPALSAGKHVFVEKPMTKTVAEADDLIDLAARNNLVLQVGHIERFNSAVMEIKRVLDRPRYIEASRLTLYSPRVKDIGVVVDLMIHDLDLILSLVPSKVARFDAVGVPVLTQHEDIASARITFEDGCVANLTASRVSLEPQRRIRIFQRDSYFSLDYQKQEIAVFRKLAQNEERMMGDPLPGINHYTLHMNREEDALTTELSDFIRCVQEGKPPVVSGEDGRRALELAIQVTEEARRQSETELAHQL
ncbi:MAG: Gfo/Idh/MocA family oxidoreductase [Candidatus Omnitrophica bacterium]|nr:scyllo-inositol 2-dehydrogenase (NAD(+)) [bacterium]NUN96462.1 Gfo/Idh/MocA family oxidoreductase [Candidatus Omnitrophota bacterium]